MKKHNKTEIETYFYFLHNIEVNQKYDKILPYSFHLEMVYNQGKKFKDIANLIRKDGDIEDYLPYSIVVGLYGHDSIEDARLTYNDIKEKFGQESAEIVYLCTENKGRNRSERKDDSFYNELKTNKLAVFVKLCDLIANVKYSLLTNSTMFDKYKSEYTYKIKPHLFTQEFKPMFDYLDKIFEIQ